MYWNSVIPPLRLVFIMWLAYTIQLSTGMDLGVYGILPRTIHGIIGIFAAPLIHGNVSHLVSNTVPLLFLGTTIFMFYEDIATRVFFHCYFFTNILVWIIGRSHYHIGASGLIYGLAGFLIFYGLFKKDFKSLLISLVVILVYGGLIYGIFPSSPHISYESHLMGFIVGITTAYTFGKRY